MCPLKRSNSPRFLLFFFGGDFGFDVHVAELAGFEDLAAFQALDVLRVFVSRNYLDSGMPTGIVHSVALRMGALYRQDNFHGSF